MEENVEVYACPDSHQTIQRIRATRVTIPPLGLPTGHDIGERSVSDIVNWSPEFISMQSQRSGHSHYVPLHFGG